MRLRKAGLSLFLALILGGCGTTFEVGFEQPPAPQAGPIAPDRLLPTLEALQGENARLRAELAAQARTPTPAPPDLGRVAYAQGGDIWIKALPDGPAQRLTSDGRNSEPRWSASGRWLAYRKERSVVVEEECDLPKPKHSLCRESVRQRQLWVVQPDQGIAGVLNDGLTVAVFAWAPQSDDLAYVDAGGALRVTPATGRRPVILAGGAGQGSVSGIAWSPDGRWIGFAQARGAEQGIWKVAPRGVPVPLFLLRDAGTGALRLAGWSDAGQHALFWQQADDGARLRAVHAGEPDAEPVTLSEEPMLPDPALLAVGNSATAIVAGPDRATWRDKRLRVLGRAGVSRPAGDYLAALGLEWSPDGARLAFAAMPSRGSIELGEGALPELMARRIWVAGADDDRAQQLTRDEAYRDEQPAWSAGGQFILFARLDAEGRASLWLIPSAGGAPARVVDEITPAPDPLGAFGLIPWEQYFDWTRGA